MRTTSYSDLRKNLSAVLDAIAADHEPIVITRRPGRPAAVLMSLEDFGWFDETAYLLSNSTNARRLRESVEALDPKGVSGSFPA